MENNQEIMFPTVPMRGLVCFPRMVMHFDVSRDMSIKAVETALKNDRKIFLTAQKNTFVNEPVKKDVFDIGVVAEIRQTLKTPDGILRLLVEGLYRAQIKNFQEGEFISCSVKKLPDYSRGRSDQVEMEAIIRSTKAVFERYIQFLPKMPEELIDSVMLAEDPCKLFENIAYNVSIDFHDKQMLLEETNILSKLGMLYANLVHEVEILEVESEIHNEVRNNLDKHQREYYLREQMRVIASQLGDEEEPQEEAYEYLDKIYEIGLSEKDTDKLVKEAERLMKIPPSAQEAFVIRTYLDTVLELPWKTKSKTKTDLKKAAKILDKDHYGLRKVKDRILESIAVHAMTKDLSGQIICLVGPPGVGKTSIGKSVAKALGREYVRISLGGIHDESDIRGHRKTYIGAMPGRIITALKQAGTNNPLMLFDEIDKMGNDFRGDPAAAMLEVLDGEQNKDFRDHYIEVPFDLSHVVFITTANTTDTIPRPLLDRMEVIELTSYTREEKFHIAKDHLIPKQIKKHGLKSSQMKVNDGALYDIIDYYTKEAGVRSLERRVASLCRKAVKEIVAGESKKVNFTKKNLESYMGPKKFTDDEISDKNEVGVVNGLAWTAVGGVMMPLEVLIMEGKGDIQTTGSLGDVMKESARLAVSYTRSVAKKYDIPDDFYKTRDIHIHAPEGAVPKDGPSAGVTMATALVSALTGIPVRHDVAMTGEITLHGKVLPIGGLREKTMAAYKSHIGTVIIPNGNKGDLEEVDEKVKENTKFVFASKIEDVLDEALCKNK